MTVKPKQSEVAAGMRLPRTPKRTEVSDDVAARFVGDPVDAPKQPSQRKRPDRGERLTVYIPPGLASDLRVLCAQQRRSLSDAVTEAVNKWIGAQGNT